MLGDCKGPQYVILYYTHSFCNLCIIRVTTASYSLYPPPPPPPPPPTGPVGKVLYQMIVVQAFRADHLLAIAAVFVATVMGESFRHNAEQELNLASIVTKEVSSM